MTVTTRSRAEMKQDAIEAKRHLVAIEREQEAQLRAEKTAKLRSLRLARDEAEKEEENVTGTVAADSEWPWNLPQAHRR